MKRNDNSSHRSSRWDGGGYDQSCDDKICIRTSWSQRDDYNSSSNNYSLGNSYPSNNSGSNIQQNSQSVHRPDHSANMQMAQEHHARFVEQSKLKALSNLKQHGEGYTLPYDDQGNRLSIDEFIKKADVFLGARIKTSTSPNSKTINQENFLKNVDEFKQRMFDHVEHRKTLLDNINKHFESPFLHSPVTIPSISIEQFKPFANYDPQEPTFKPLSQLEKYSQINEALGLNPRKQAVSDVIKSYNPLQLLNQNQSLLPFQKKEQPQDIDEQQLKKFDGGLRKFISNLEEMDKSGNAQDEVLKTIHFTHSREATRYCSNKEPGSKPQHGSGFWGVKVPIPLNDQDISEVIPYLPRFSLDYLCINNSKITDLGIATLMHTTLQVKTLNLSNNNLGDPAAKIISQALVDGKMPATKYIDVSGNKITKDGETKLVQALKGKVQDMIIITKKLEQNSKLFPGIGTKDEKIAIYKEFIKQGIEKGTYDKGIVVDKSLWGEIKNTSNQLLAAGYGGIGFIKCNWKPEEMVKSYAQDKITAKISKFFSKVLGQFTDIEGIVSCYLEATDAAWTSPEGMKTVQHELCVLGEQEFCGD